MIRGVFVTGTSTEVGKTFVSRGLITSLRKRGYTVAGLKPLETDCQPHPLDARALARASARPALADAPGFYRAEPPLAPYAIARSRGPSPPAVHVLAARTRQLAADLDFTLVEGAGGLLVPLDAQHTIADLASALQLPLLLVARDELGVLSHTLAAAEAATRRGLTIAAVVLVAAPDRIDPDPSGASNAGILQELLRLPVLRFPRTADDDEALSHASDASGLTQLLEGRKSKVES